MLRLAGCPVSGRKSAMHGEKKSSRTALKFEFESKLTKTLGFDENFPKADHTCTVELG